MPFDAKASLNTLRKIEIAMNNEEMSERIIRIDERTGAMTDALFGTERHGDIGLVRRLGELERNAITKGQVAAFTAFVSAVTAVVTSVFHGWFSGK